MIAIVIYTFDDEKYAEMRKSDAHSEIVAAQIGHAVTTQGQREITLYLSGVDVDDVVETIECML